MADDIEEFLRRVAEKRRAQQGGRPAQQPQQQRPQQRPPQQRPPQQPPQQRPPPLRPVAPPPVVQPPPSVPDAALAEAPRFPVSTQELQRHGQEYMSRAEFEQRSKQAGLHAKELPHLESKVAQSMPARVSQASAAAAKPLGEGPMTVVAAASAESISLADLLKSPQAFRTAYLLSLVLDRPAWKEIE